MMSQTQDEDITKNEAVLVNRNLDKNHHRRQLIPKVKNFCVIVTIHLGFIVMLRKRKIFDDN